MLSKYKPGGNIIPHFVAFAVVGWVIKLSDSYRCEQRLNYLHENRIRSGLVWGPSQYKYSSAIDYYTNEHGLLPIEYL